MNKSAELASAVKLFLAGRHACYAMRSAMF